MADAITAALDIAVSLIEADEEDQSSGEADGTYERDPAVWEQFEVCRLAFAEARAANVAREASLDSAVRLLGDAKILMAQMMDPLIGRVAT